MATSLTVIGDSGTAVDWWFIYKISKASRSPKGQAATGHEYLYFDSDMAKKRVAPQMSTHSIDTSGALFDTYSQLFSPGAKANKRLGYYCYNDEDRYEPGKRTGTGPSSPCGHCKGALAFDLASDSAFWLIHSVPLLPMNAAFVYPPTGFKEAQALLCVQLPDADSSKAIAQLMYRAHGPNVNVASDLLTVANNPSNNFRKPPVTDVPRQLGYAPGSASNDPRLLLMQNKNASSGSKPAPFSDSVSFVSKGGQKFQAIAKNRGWGDPAVGQKPLDFYNDLVSVVLNENLEVETWEDARGKVPPEVEHGEKHHVENMHAVNLQPLGIPWSWTEQLDHAKLCISDRTNPPGSPHWVCVGDINYTDSMEKRGGGTVALVCDPLWQALAQVLSAAEEAGAGTPARAPVRGKKSPRAAPARKTPPPKKRQAPKKKATPRSKAVPRKKAAPRKKLAASTRRRTSVKRSTAKKTTGR